jgi:putative transcriptional regulator
MNEGFAIIKPNRTNSSEGGKLMSSKKQVLKVLRGKRGITQEDIAASLGINPQYYSMIERGVRTPGFKLAKRIADFFQCSVDAIFFENQQNTLFGADRRETKQCS